MAVRIAEQQPPWNSLCRNVCDILMTSLSTKSHHAPQFRAYSNWSLRLLPVWYPYLGVFSTQAYHCQSYPPACTSCCTPCPWPACWGCWKISLKRISAPHHVWGNINWDFNRKMGHVTLFSDALDKRLRIWERLILGEYMKDFVKSII